MFSSSGVFRDQGGKLLDGMESRLYLEGGSCICGMWEPFREIHVINDRMRKKMNIKIFVMTHKLFERPNDPMYVPLQVGHALHGTLDESYLRDDGGEDNISGQNPYFSELTGMYWIWKQCRDTDYVGVCHYRRFPVIKDCGRERLMTEGDCERILKEYDLITTEKLTLHSNYYEGFAVDHNLHDLQVTEQVVQEKYPDFAACFERLVHSNQVYFGNICVMPKRLYDEYCSFLFDILFEVQRRIDVTGYDGYRKRVFGFLSEFLQMVWIQVRGLKPYECRIAIIGEKFETGEVKRTLSGFFKNRDVQGAKDYFLKCYEKRPDILMEASDITGDLRICMQIISTCEFEKSASGSCILDKENDMQRLVLLFKALNGAVLRMSKGEDTEADRGMLESGLITETGVAVAMRVMGVEK